MSLLPEHIRERIIIDAIILKKMILVGKMYIRDYRFTYFSE